jgi:hypothetical protein
LFVVLAVDQISTSSIKYVIISFGCQVVTLLRERDDPETRMEMGYGLGDCGASSECDVYFGRGFASKFRLESDSRLRRVLTLRYISCLSVTES